jgi:DNA-binding NarL/FixJ family response regulator
MNSRSLATAAISIVLVDDHAIVRAGLAALCDSRPDLRIAGQCADGLAAVEMIKSLTPDFAIIDLQLPKLHGLEVICKVRETNSVCKLVVLTINRDESMVRDALRAGANGYVLKDGPSRHLLDAISYIQNGGVYISPLLRPDDPLSSTPGPRYSDDDPEEGSGVPSPLSPRRPRHPPKAGRAGAALRFDAKLADAVAMHRRSLTTPRAPQNGKPRNRPAC